MAEEALVESDVRKGSEFVELLDRIGVPVKGALWHYQPDADRWRLIIFTDEARRGTTELYLRAVDAGAALDMTSVDFQTTDSPLFKALGGMIRLEGIGSVRMRQNTFNGIYVQDALIYRLAA